MENMKQLSTIETRAFKALIAVRELIAETMLIEGTDREEKQLKRMFINLTKIKAEQGSMQLQGEDVKYVKEKGKELKDKKEVIMKQIKIKGF